MKSKTYIVSLAALVAVLLITGCAGPAVRHDYRVDNRVDNRDNRQDYRHDRRTSY